jgi:peptide/nickel transport system permease protein
MVRFVLSRIGQTLAVLFTVSVIIFALMRMIPGDPALMRLGDDFTQEAYDRLRGELGFDRSIVMQYLIWLGQVLSGDLGNSYLNHERVSRLVLEAFVPTLILVVASVVVGILIAVPSGIVAAMRKDSLWDYGSMGFAIFVYSMPSFWKGITLIWIFSVYLGWFPAMGYVPPWTNLTQGLWRLVLPAVTLGTFFSGLVARIIRSSFRGPRSGLRQGGAGSRRPPGRARVQARPGQCPDPGSDGDRAAVRDPPRWRGVDRDRVRHPPGWGGSRSTPS